MAKSLLRTEIVNPEETSIKLSDLSAMLIPAAASEINISIKKGLIVVQAKERSGKNLYEKIYREEGVVHKETMSCEKLTVQKRRSLVKTLRKQHLTQAEIAKRIGVSQKTVSMDLAAITTKK